MAVQPIPEGYRTITPYLIVKNVPGLIEFLKEAFGAKELHRSSTPDGQVNHAEMEIGDSRLMMGEASDQWPAIPGSILLYVPDVDECYQRALDAGAESVMEVADQFYGDRSGGVQDLCGNRWWIATHKEDLSHEEIARRAAKHARK
jgi:PhnB protein